MVLNFVKYLGLLLPLELLPITTPKPISMDFNVFQWISWDFTGFHGISMDFNRFQ